MKNKKNIYVLFPVVLIIWGIIGYRIFHTLKPKNSIPHVAEQMQFKPQQLENAETFTINANYRDPFLGTLTKKNKPIKVVPKNVGVKKVTIPFPTIVYKGVISPKGKQRQVFLIAINGQQFFFKLHSTHEQVKLIRGNDKEVVLKFQGLQQTVLLEN